MMPGQFPTMILGLPLHSSCQGLHDTCVMPYFMLLALQEARLTMMGRWDKAALFSWLISWGSNFHEIYMVF